MFYFGQYCIFCSLAINILKKSGSAHKKLMEQKYSLQQYQAEDVDQARLGKLVKDSFGRELVPDYFTGHDISRIILEKDYRGVAVLKDHEDWLYLDKFCVAPELQCNGLGREIFQRMLEQSGGKGIFWRSKQPKSIQWYFDKASEFNIQSVSADPWTVFWIGSDPGERLIYAMSKRETLK
jgi:acetylglutamate synthase